MPHAKNRDKCRDCRQRRAFNRAGEGASTVRITRRPRHDRLAIMDATLA
jgi:hypothetical protein